MKKKSSISPKGKKQVNEPASAYKITPEDAISQQPKRDGKDKVFNKIDPPQDFPEDCVTLDTFFSDLEDYIHQNEKI